MHAHMPPYTKQQPTGAYRSTEPELSASERKLRTALAYVNHARDLILQALEQPSPKEQREAKVAYDMACDGKFGCGDLTSGNEGAVHLSINNLSERVPKWDPRWGVPLTERKGYSQGSHTGTTGPIPQNQPPNCDGHHPMQAEALRDHDERLAGGEDRL